MNKKFKSSVHFGDSDDEDFGEAITLDTFDPRKNDVLLIPWTVKLTTPYLIYHFPDLIEFLRFDLINYPKVKHEPNAPYPYPFLEVFNMEGRLLHEVNFAFKTRAQMNRILQSYNQLPKDTLQWLTPLPRPILDRSPDSGPEYRPYDVEENGVCFLDRPSDISSVNTDFTASTPDTIISE